MVPGAGNRAPSGQYSLEGFDDHFLVHTGIHVGVGIGPGLGLLEAFKLRDYQTAAKSGRPRIRAIDGRVGPRQQQPALIG